MSARLNPCFFVCYLIHFEVFTAISPLPIPETTPVLDSPQTSFQKIKSHLHSQNWQLSKEQILQFIENYGTLPETQDAANQLKPYLCYALIQTQQHELAIKWIPETLLLSNLNPSQKNDLHFCYSLSLIHLQQFEQARVSLLSFYQQSYASPYFKLESILLYTNTLFAEKKFADTISFLEQQMTKLSKTHLQTQANLLLAQSHINLQQSNQAHSILIELDHNRPQIDQLVFYQNLLFELADTWQRQHQYYRAIECLQRIWPQQKTIYHQQQQLNQIEASIRTLQPTAFAHSKNHLHLSKKIKLERELLHFQKNTHFDYTRLSRLVQLYLQINRPLQATVCIEELLKQPHPNEVAFHYNLTLLHLLVEQKNYPTALQLANQLLQNSAALQNSEKSQILHPLANTHFECQHWAEAASAFAQLAHITQDKSSALQAKFLQAISLLMDDQWQQADPIFLSLSSIKNNIAEESSYWLAMSAYFQNRHQDCLEHFTKYDQEFQNHGKYLAHSSFQKAKCYLALAKPSQAQQLLISHLKNTPETPFLAQTKILLGDIAASEGQLEEALQHYTQVNSEDSATYCEAHFKITKILKAQQKFQNIINHEQTFLDQHHKSTRYAESVYHLGQALSHLNQLEKAREYYQTEILKHGNNPLHQGIEDLLAAWPKLYPKLEYHQFLTQIQLLKNKAHQQKPIARVLLSRLHWIEGLFFEKSDPQKSHAEYLQSAQYLDAQTQHPKLLLAAAKANHALSLPLRSTEFYQAIIRHHPRSLEVDHALFGLAQLAFVNKNTQLALQYTDRILDHNLVYTLHPEVKLFKIQVFLEQKQYQQAQSLCQAQLEIKNQSIPIKIKLLQTLAQLHQLQNNPLQACACYERIYLAYSKDPNACADAYAQRYSLLKKLNKETEALATRQACLENANLKTQAGYLLLLNSTP
jgi:tetratricopeptide (TPR) repeat protein